jgi:hypothetical protein
LIPSLKIPRRMSFLCAFPALALYLTVNGLSWCSIGRPSSPPMQRKRSSKGFSQQEQHQFQESHFNRPTWCGHCTYFVISPFGKQGYSCECT